jgi:DNA-binding IclR family transcriptional regulator
MAGIDRYMDVLNLFTTTRSMWTIPEVSQALDVPTSTTYRTMRELTRVNLLEPAIDGRYRLGPAFIEFERRTRLTDPLTRVAAPLLPELVHQAGVPCLAVLARLYGATVMCVADAKSPQGVVQTSYERGRPMPLTRGATSKVILAQLPKRRLDKLLSSLPAREMPATIEAFRQELTVIRKNGYAAAHSEVDEGRVGLAVPVSLSAHGLMASLSLVLNAAEVNQNIEGRLLLILISSAALLVEQIASPVPDGF